MKKIILFPALMILSLSVFAQQIAEESIVINIEVPVRVFRGDTFIDNLTIKDFELYEDGEPQTLEAVYLINKRSIERSEEKRRFTPDTERNFYLFFEVSEYTAKLGNAVEFFVRNVLFPGDVLTIVTPVKTYRMRSAALEHKTRQEIVEQLKGILRKDALTGSSEYRNTIEDLTDTALSLTIAFLPENEEMQQNENTSAELVGRSIGEQLNMYYNLLMRLESLRQVDQKLLLDFADYLQDEPGQKYVFLFYQREFIPQIEPRLLNQYIVMYQDRPNVQHTAATIFDFYRREISFDVDRVKKAYADASIAIHFLFLTEPVEPRFGIRFQEKSEDIFSAFAQMAAATGGLVDSSSDPAVSFEKALDAAENYYLLYYSPKNRILNGDFRNITVQVKQGKYRITHRLGYFAD
jgi:VWFA-related protein